MDVKAQPVISWIKENVPALTWTTIKLKYMEVFIKAKVSPNKVDENTVFNEEIISCINKSLKEKFNKELPRSLTS